MTTYRFGPFIFDSVTRQLTAESKTQELRPQVALALEYFLQHPDTAVEKEGLF